MGRSKVSTASGDLEVDFASDLAYNLSLHSGSGSTVINLNGHELASNLEILTFRGEGKVISDFDMTEAEEFYSDALNRYYDLRKVQIKNTFPMTSISTGNGSITVRK